MEEAQGRGRRRSLFDIARTQKQKTGTIQVVSIPPVSSEEQLSKHKVKYENSYQLEPDSKLQTNKIASILQQILSQHLEGACYNPLTTSLLCKVIANDVEREVKKLGYKRYKFVCMVTIGQKQNEDITIASRCLWDPQRDNFVTEVFENLDFYAVSTVFAIYYE
ncbi:tctex1 domain-containing protein 1-like [Limulus polyphemus]|uniref:Tctex1 domain-containing protein 1-like n=1 Tax=Limulus polyphemus TaxID=6850 RepID=A0ABM1RUY3_LIMPO|nr:tctex1 domain-containing protein 1-like [Limulus polyphemus]XP_022235187.1 tctex1 domain-containing protein 1-like [Limulus polyphemus]XP_022235188.1 tctex1 domain-containing protein 1-like [Limulus polyphemus]XP_022235189.1 tctex1 domain-containing protein 1-like [Limulus polyphemus]